LPSPHPDRREGRLHPRIPIKALSGGETPGLKGWEFAGTVREAPGSRPPHSGWNEHTLNRFSHSRMGSGRPFGVSHIDFLREPLTGGRGTRRGGNSQGPRRNGIKLRQPGAPFEMGIALIPGRPVASRKRVYLSEIKHQPLPRLNTARAPLKAWTFGMGVHSGMTRALYLVTPPLANMGTTPWGVFGKTI
jgi:hypothetical protein